MDIYTLRQQHPEFLSIFDDQNRFYYQVFTKVYAPLTETTMTPASVSTLQQDLAAWEQKRHLPPTVAMTTTTTTAVPRASSSRDALPAPGPPKPSLLPVKWASPGPARPRKKKAPATDKPLTAGPMTTSQSEPPLLQALTTKHTAPMTQQKPAVTKPNAPVSKKNITTTALEMVKSMLTKSSALTVTSVPKLPLPRHQQAAAGAAGSGLHLPTEEMERLSVSRGSKGAVTLCAIEEMDTDDDYRPDANEREDSPVEKKKRKSTTLEASDRPPKKQKWCDSVPAAAVDTNVGTVDASADADVAMAEAEDPAPKQKKHKHAPKPQADNTEVGTLEAPVVTDRSEVPADKQPKPKIVNGIWVPPCHHCSMNGITCEACSTMRSKTCKACAANKVKCHKMEAGYQVFREKEAEARRKSCLAQKVKKEQEAKVTGGAPADKSTTNDKAAPTGMTATTVTTGKAAPPVKGLPKEKPAPKDNVSGKLKKAKKPKAAMETLQSEAVPTKQAKKEKEKVKAKGECCLPRHFFKFNSNGFMAV